MEDRPANDAMTETEKPAEQAPDASRNVDAPLKEIDNKIDELESMSEKLGLDLVESISNLQQEKDQILKSSIENLSPWDRVELARHRDRPTSNDYISQIFTDFVELHGDRAFADDQALITGLGTIGDHKVMIVANEEGHGVKEMRIRNFGMAHPEGYRKAKLKMQFAVRLQLPIVTFIDTKGAFPGIDAEERGQAMAIAENLKVMASLRTPTLAIIIGEGGSGGALGIGITDRICAQENSYFSVITPEGCSAILWKSADRRKEAAAALKLDPSSLVKLGIVDEIIPEPLGGAHRDPRQAGEIVKEVIVRNLDHLKKIEMDELLKKRYEKYRNIGAYVE